MNTDPHDILRAAIAQHARELRILDRLALVFGALLCLGVLASLIIIGWPWF